jgi:ABC-type methionine transport system ATPase subunit
MYNLITHQLVIWKQKGHQVFQINDRDVEKQQRLKAIHDTNKNKIVKQLLLTKFRKSLFAIWTGY